MGVSFWIIPEFRILRPTLHRYYNRFPDFLTVNSLTARGEFCCLLIIFANSLDADQAHKSVRPCLDLNSLTNVSVLERFF